MYNNFTDNQQLTVHNSPSPIPHPRTSKKKFTLIELLVVIAIIGILVAMLMPVLTSVRKRARITKAKAEMNAIITAIKSYESTYGILPVPASWTNGDIGTPYDHLMTLLTDVPAPNSSTAYENSRHIRFLDVPDNYTTDSYLNPWQGKYEVYMDTDYDYELTGPPPDNDTLYGTVFIATDDGGGDRVYSWK